jgi:hypothetical protein
MPQVSIGPSRLIFNYRSITAEFYTLIPRLRLDFDVHYALTAGQPAYNLAINFGRSELKVIARGGENLYVGMATPAQMFLMLTPNSSFSSNLYIDLDYYKLSQIEKVREGGDLRAHVDIFFIAELQQQPPVKYPEMGVSFDLRIPKSDWVETILPQLKYKEVSLIELPKIEKPEFGDVATRINEAWKQYSMGEYDKVLTECRKAMEALITVVKNRGFQKEITDEKGKRVVPDWEKALGHKEVGDIVEVFVQKLFGFLAPGSHYGKSINKEDAELAIMNTHALINYVTKKL